MFIHLGDNGLAEAEKYMQEEGYKEGVLVESCGDLICGFEIAGGSCFT